MMVLQPDLADASVVDLFAGSGALGLEALSRGAATADFVDVSVPSLRAIRDNGEAFGALGQMRVHRADAMRFAQRLAPYAYDVAFADPPYDLGMASKLAALWSHSQFARILGIEHSVREGMPEGGVTRRYGDAAITIYRADPGHVAVKQEPPGAATTA
jgi:16S rRNA (guanine966-N2)-methyltransferase